MRPSISERSAVPWWANNSAAEVKQQATGPQCADCTLHIAGDVKDLHPRLQSVLVFTMK